MSLRINQNIDALNSYRNLSVTQGQMSKSLEKLSSGYRINRAADDAAGLAISEGLRSQVGGIKVAVRNAQDGVSVVQTAEGALTETHSILQRMRDLAVQSANDSNDDNSRSAINAEATALNNELSRISDKTTFNNINLLDGSFQAKDFQVGYAANDTIAVDVTSGSAARAAASATAAKFVSTDNLKADFSTTNKTFKVNGTDVTLNTDLSSSSDTAIKTAVDAAFTAASVTGVTTSVTGGKLTITNSTAGAGTVTSTLTGTATAGTDAVTAVAAGSFGAYGLGVESVDLTTKSGSQSAITAIDTAIKAVSSSRAKLGALQNRFEHTINNLSVTQENLSASESRIRDTDMASEMMNFTRSQILSQAGTAMLAQANSAPQNVLSLLRG